MKMFGSYLGIRVSRHERKMLKSLRKKSVPAPRRRSLGAVDPYTPSLGHCYYWEDIEQVEEIKAQRAKMENFQRRFKLLLDLRRTLRHGFSVERAANGVSTFLNTYKEGMSSILQGYREVTLNKKEF